MAEPAFPVPQVSALVGELGCLFPWVFLIPYVTVTLLGIISLPVVLENLLFTDLYKTLWRGWSWGLGEGHYKSFF